MKILIISDTHGNQDNFDKVIEIEKDIDMLVHLGDLQGADAYISLKTKCPCYMVAGNNDFHTILKKELFVDIPGHRLMLTHGHYYYVNYGYERLVIGAKANGSDIVMFGHTHKPYEAIMDDVLVLNPGSLSYPRQEGRIPTYMIMNVENDGKYEVNLKFLEK